MQPPTIVSSSDFGYESVSNRGDGIIKEVTTAEVDTARDEKSMAEKEPPALYTTPQPDDQSRLYEEDKYLHGRALVLTTLSLMVGVFTVALDNSIISSAMWHGMAPSTCLRRCPSNRRLGKPTLSSNLKWVWLVSGFLFEAGSVICAAAPNSPVFITGRAVAGVGAAGLFCGAMIIMSRIVEMRKRPLLLGIVTSMYGVASVVGPSLGGVFTHSARLTWRFCFWINLPLGGLTGLIVCFYYPSSLSGAPYKSLPLRQKVTSLGLKSAAILTGTLVCLILALQWGGSVYPWSDSRVWGCFLGFGLLLALFGYTQYHQKDDALIPLRVLFQRSILLGCIFSCLLQGAMLTQTYYLPFYFQAVRGTNPQTSGFSILPYGVTISIATLISGTLVTLSRFYVPFMWVGSSIFITGSGLLYTLSRSSPFAKWFGYQVLTGTGYGVMVQIPITAIQVVLVAEDIPLGSTLVILAQCLGGSVGLAIAENVFRNALYTHLLALQGVDVPVVEAAGGAELQDIVPAELLGPVRDAFKVAVSNAFLVAVGLGGVAFLASVGMERKRIMAKGG